MSALEIKQDTQRQDNTAESRFQNQILLAKLSKSIAFCPFITPKALVPEFTKSKVDNIIEVSFSST